MTSVFLVASAFNNRSSLAVNTSSSATPNPATKESPSTAIRRVCGGFSIGRPSPRKPSKSANHLRRQASDHGTHRTPQERSRRSRQHIAAQPRQQNDSNHNRIEEVVKRCRRHQRRRTKLPYQDKLHDDRQGEADGSHDD